MAEVTEKWGVSSAERRRVRRRSEIGAKRSVFSTKTGGALRMTDGQRSRDRRERTIQMGHFTSGTCRVGARAVVVRPRGFGARTRAGTNPCESQGSSSPGARASAPSGRWTPSRCRARRVWPCLAKPSCAAPRSTPCRPPKRHTWLPPPAASAASARAEARSGVSALRGGNHRVLVE